MKVPPIMIRICFSAIFFILGCSPDEQPPPLTKPKVVKAIKKPAPPKFEKAEIPEEKSSEGEALQPEKADEMETGTIEEKSAGAEGLKPIAAAAPEKKEKPGTYIVQSGESLWNIAGKTEIYGDSLKWPIIYRMNLSRLENMEADIGLPSRELPEGMKLKYITREEVQENLNSKTIPPWVVNVLSATTREKINPVAIKLIKNGYPVYITTARVKGTDWMRIRIGFFHKKSEADAVGKKIMGTLQSRDSWSTKAGDVERKTYGGY